MLVYDDIEPVNKIMIYDKGVEVCPPYSDTEEEFCISYRDGEAVPYPIEWREPLRIQCQHFLDSIAQGKEPRSNGRMGLEVVKILESAQHSLLDGGIREVIGESRGFCAYRTRREAGSKCEDICFREPVRL
jgi:predicted dehydrogenase